MLLIDAFFRFSGIGLMLLIILLALRDLPRSSCYYLLIVTNSCLICHFIGFTPTEFNLPDTVRAVTRSIDVFLLPTAWLFTLSLFEKDFRIRVIHSLVVLVVAGALFAERMVYYNWLAGLPGWWPTIINILAFGLVFHMLLITLLGRNDDLLEKRRRTRLYLVSIIALSTTLAILIGSISLPQHQPTVNAISLWPAIVASCFWLFQIEPQAFAFKESTTDTSQKLSSQDLRLKQQLESAIHTEQVYLKRHLSVNKLASHLGVSPTRLRTFINQQLGHANFSSYINGYRVEAIKSALDLRDKDHIPILTLALEYGFNSLPPFNRAFKKHMGMTPTEYRKKSQN
jgi:AraC-like DNA-binding protein